MAQALKTAGGPVEFTPDSMPPLPPAVRECFGVQSVLSMPVQHPKLDGPDHFYYFSVHECSYPRVWTAQEVRLFEEIGRRLGDALTTLLMFRNLRQSEARLEEAQRIAHVGHWERDLDTDCLIGSDETYRILGLPPQAGPIDFARLQDMIHPDDRELTVRATEEALGGGRYELECRVVRPRGEVRIVHCRGDVQRDDAGRPRRMFGTIQDITERKRTEAELRRARAGLARGQRDSILGEMAAAIAHEIRQPIAAAMIDATACLRALADNRVDLQEARRAASRMVKEATWADEALRRTTALYKQETTRRERVDVNAVIREMTVLLQQEAGAHSISVRTELAESIPDVRADRVQLQQVFMNLMLNAIEAMKDTGGELTISSQVNQEGELLISVSDTGVGLPTENADQIFDAFVTTKPQGTGMGLAITRSIVESHGGRVWATANTGPGATFLFTLPGEAEERRA